MKLTLTKKTENKLLGRVEIAGSLVFEGPTPSNIEVASALANELHADLSLIVIKSIHTKFRMKTAVLTAYLYHSADNKRKMEAVTKHMKKKADEAAGKKPAEEQKSEGKKKK